MKKNTLFQILFFGMVNGISISLIYLIPLTIISYYFFLKNVFKQENNKNAFILGWFFGIGFFLSSMHWIIYPFLIFEKHYLLAPFILIIFPLLMGLFFSIPSLLTYYFFNFLNRNSFFFNSFIVSVFFFISEIARSKLFGGLPFNLYAHIWAFENKFIQVVKYVGVFGLSFMTINWFVVLAMSVIEKKKTLFLVVFLFFPSFLFLFSKLNFNETRINEESLKIRIVQPNISQKDKWDRALMKKNLDKLISMSNKNLEEKDTLIIWPEVAIPFILKEEKILLEYIRKRIFEKSILVTGALNREISKESTKLFNSLYVIDRESMQIYDKQKLVPFGEFFPLKKFFNFSKLTEGSRDFSSGTKKKIINLRFLENEINFEPSICYEAIFQSFNSYHPNIIINITNDAWFGNTTGPRQHLAASIFRSLEKGIPLVRVANSGISVITDKKGKILKEIKHNSSGYLDHELELKTKETLFMKYGNFVILIILFFNVVLFFSLDKFLQFKKRLKKKIF